MSISCRTRGGIHRACRARRPAASLPPSPRATFFQAHSTTLLLISFSPPRHGCRASSLGSPPPSGRPAAPADRHTSHRHVLQPPPNFPNFACVSEVVEDSKIVRPSSRPRPPPRPCSHRTIMSEATTKSTRVREPTASHATTAPRDASPGPQPARCPRRSLSGVCVGGGSRQICAPCCCARGTARRGGGRGD